MNIDGRPSSLVNYVCWSQFSVQSCVLPAIRSGDNPGWAGFSVIVR